MEEKKLRRFAYMIDGCVGIPNHFSQRICGCDEASNSNEPCGDDGGVCRVCNESAKESQNAENCGPEFYLCSSFVRRFPVLPTPVGHLANRSSLALHGNAM